MFDPGNRVSTKQTVWFAACSPGDGPVGFKAETDTQTSDAAMPTRAAILFLYYFVWRKNL